MRCYSPEPQSRYAITAGDFTYQPAEPGDTVAWNLIWLSIPKVDEMLLPIPDRSAFYAGLNSGAIGRLRALTAFSEDGVTVESIMGPSPTAFVRDFTDAFDLPSMKLWSHLGGQAWLDCMTARAYQAEGMSELLRSAKLSKKILLVDFSLGKKYNLPVEREEILSQTNVEKQQPKEILIPFYDSYSPKNEDMMKDLSQDTIRPITTTTDNTKAEISESTLVTDNNKSGYELEENGIDIAEAATTPTDQAKQLAEFVNQIDKRSPLNPKNLRDFIAINRNGIEQKSLASSQPFHARRTQELQIAYYLITAYRQLVKHGQKTPFNQAISDCSNWKGLLTAPIKNLFIKYYEVARERRIDRPPYNSTIESEIAADVMEMFSVAAKEVEIKLAATRAKRAAKKGQIIDGQDEKLAEIKWDEIKATAQPITQTEQTDFGTSVVVDNSLPIAITLDQRDYLEKQFEASINRIENMLESLPLAQSLLLKDIDKPHQHSNPMAKTFATELAGLRQIFLSTLQSHHSLSTCDQITDDPESEICEMGDIETAFSWLVEQSVISLSELRARLLPLDLLPNAVIDEINERALDLANEPALIEDSDRVIVQREILMQVIAAWD